MVVIKRSAVTWCAGGTLSLGGFELACDACSSTLDRPVRAGNDGADDDDDDTDIDSLSPSASMSVVRDSFISNDSPSAIFSPLNNFFFFDSLATSSSGGSNQPAAGILHPPLQPVTYWNDRRLPTWKWLRRICLLVRLLMKMMYRVTQKSVQLAFVSKKYLCTPVQNYPEWWPIFRPRRSNS